MKQDLPFREITPADRVSVTFGGRALELPAGLNLAAALMVVGQGDWRKTPVSGAPRGAFCMMGACYDCLITVDGRREQACLTPVREGMVIDPIMPEVSQ